MSCVHRREIVYILKKNRKDFKHTARIILVQTECFLSLSIIKFILYPVCVILSQKHESYCSNLTLINITNFQFLINTDICNVTNIGLVTLVHTAMEHVGARNVIR